MKTKCFRLITSALARGPELRKRLISRDPVTDAIKNAAFSNLTVKFDAVKVKRVSCAPVASVLTLSAL